MPVLVVPLGPGTRQLCAVHVRLVPDTGGFLREALRWECSVRVLRGAPGCRSRGHTQRPRVPRLDPHADVGFSYGVVCVCFVDVELHEFILYFGY